ncbi:hypothetical protein ACFY3M_47610 [Streptomyces mirabilis]|uniref:hypothetical protein n=1 Tax=Streptomyces mirabilis TaxID=68239 RepID=UPI0036D09A5A
MVERCATRLVRRPTTALKVVVVDEEVLVSALEHDDLEIGIVLDFVHQDVQFREHLRVEKVQRGIVDDDAPVERRLPDDAESIGDGHDVYSVRRVGAGGHGAGHRSGTA